MDIKNTRDLEKVLRQAAKQTVEDVGKEVKAITQEEIDKAVYSIPEGQYKRTGDLRNSLQNYPVEEKGHMYEVEIKHDVTKMRANPSQFQHASPYWSPWDYRRYVAQTVHDGLSGSLFGTAGHWLQPKPYFDNTKERLNSNKEHVKAAKDSLKKQGFTVK